MQDRVNKMRKFLDITEQKGQIIFTFGRFNPPTTGHENLIQKVASVAGSIHFVSIHLNHKIQRKTHYPLH